MNIIIIADDNILEAPNNNRFLSNLSMVSNGYAFDYSIEQQETEASTGSLSIFLAPS